MKRVFLLCAGCIALFAACVLPVSTASADSLSGPAGLFEQTQSASGDMPVDWLGDFENAPDPFFGESAAVSNEFLLLRAVLPQAFTPETGFENIPATFDYYSAALELPGPSAAGPAPRSGGQFPSIPLPAAALLFGTGLIGLMALRKSR